MLSIISLEIVDSLGRIIGCIELSIFSDWNKLKKITAWFVNAKRNFKKANKGSPDELENKKLYGSTSEFITVETMNCAEKSAQCMLSIISLEIVDSLGRIIGCIEL
jgi:hypothetical protein